MHTIRSSSIRRSLRATALATALLLVAAACGDDGEAPVGGVGELSTVPPVAPASTASDTVPTTPPTATETTIDLDVTVPGEVVPTTVPLSDEERQHQWELDGAVVSFEVPPAFAADPREGRDPIDPGDLADLPDDERIEVLYSCVDTVECGCSIQLQVRPRPADDMPIHQLEAYDTVTVDGTDWDLVDMSNGDRAATMALAFTDDLMVTLTGPAERLPELPTLVRIEQVQ